MLLARVHGHATATVKHESLVGEKLLLVQPLRSLTREPLLALDRLGAAAGDLVVITSDGLGARELVGDPTSPARWFVAGIVDDPAHPASSAEEARYCSALAGSGDRPRHGRPGAEDRPPQGRPGTYDRPQDGRAV